MKRSRKVGYANRAFVIALIALVLSISAIEISVTQNKTSLQPISVHNLQTNQVLLWDGTNWINSNTTLIPGTIGYSGQTGNPNTPSSVWYNNATTPTSSIGVNGDYFFDSANGNVYQNQNNIWVLIGNLDGPTGPQGAQGNQGEAGTNGINGINGSTWYNGSGAPTSGIGLIGDYYLATSTGNIYQKNGSSWSLIGNIQGAAGTNGSNGSNGISVVWESSLASAPSSPQTDWAYYNTVNGESYIYNGAAWVELCQNGATGSTGATGPAGANALQQVNSYAYIIYQSSGTFYAQNGLTGAIAYSSTNAATVINDATANAKGVTYILNGNYPLNAAINVYSNNPLIGESEYGVNLYLVAGTGANVIQAVNQGNITIEDLTVNPNSPVNPQTGIAATSSENSQCGISLRDCSVGLIQQVNELDAGWDGIQAMQSCGITINQCNAYNNSWHGIQLWDCSGNCTIESCTTSLVGAPCAGIVDELAVDSSTSTATIEGNTVGNCFQGIFVDSNGISTTNVADNQLFNNVCGIWVQLSSNVQVIGNLINQPSSASGYPGIYVNYDGAGCSNCLISQNTIIAYGHGIFVESVNDCIISNNNIQGKDTSGRAGIYAGDPVPNGNFGSINNNIIYNFVTGIDITGSNVVNAVISNNQFNTVTTKITDLGTSTYIYTNLGYNPVGSIANPISSGGSTLVDSGSSSTWVSGTTYTNWGSPKVLYISGGTVTAIVYDGQTLYTAATTCGIILQPSDSFSITFSSTPTIVVFGQ